ncbi:LacI family DNA-binding transcriptional regulator [Streptomyces sp. NPDC048419]|uniref:LacI family DNA-binding transcriptional regulator n=1 Tax=Streptomyces sp. NPDC048419 TaxID=3365547 RepID=UPI00371A2631
MSAPGSPRVGDVARAAGVSAQTVSNVMNNRGRFSDDARQRVLAAAHKLGYVPNRNARSLRLRRSRQIGIHMSSQDLDVHNPFAISLLRALIEAADKVDHQIVVFTHRRDTPPEPRTFAGHGVDGYVLFNSGPADPRPAILTELSIPFALMGRTAPGLPQTWVDIDNAAAMATLVDYLVIKGHRSFAYAEYDTDAYWMTERLTGARNRLREHGIKLAESDVVVDSPDAVRTAVQRMLARKHRPSVIMHGSDTLAVATHKAAVQAGLTPGQDIAITGFFETLEDLAELEPPLTSVHVALPRVAALIIDRIITEIEHGPTGSPGTILDTTISVGGSA